MKKTMKMKNYSLIGLAVLATSCASDIKKAPNYEQFSAAEAISQAELTKQQALDVQADVLAKKSYSNGEDYLEEAREDKDNKEELKSVQDDSAIAAAYFTKSKALSKERMEKFKSILSARDSAILAGANSNDNTKEYLEEIDEDLIDSTDNFEKLLSPKSTAEIQNKYLEVKVKTIQSIRLGLAEKILNKLNDKDDAEDRASSTFQTAKKDVLIAKNLIAKNPSNPENYEESVSKAINSTLLLNDVISVIHENGKDTPEKAALKIVMQKRKLSNTKTDLKALESIVNSQYSEILVQHNAILSQSDKIAFQKAMDNVRKEFRSDEAEVYQQGNKLIIRLKDMDFKVGDAIVPNESKSTVRKVSMIMKDLETKKIIVQGHTDSTGSNKINKSLSQERAKNVAAVIRKSGVDQNIEYEGFGSNKPLADNETKEGRALNRRVDVVVIANSPNELI